MNRLGVILAAGTVVAALGIRAMQREEPPPEPPVDVGKLWAERAWDNWQQMTLGSGDPPPQQQQLGNDLVKPEPRPPKPPPRPAPSECISSGTIATFEVGSVLRACFDRDGDGSADRCVRWRLDGKPLDYDPAVDEIAVVETTEETPEPATSHSMLKDNDDGRIEASGNMVEICPPERACMKIIPRMDGAQSFDDVVTDPGYHRAAMSIPEQDGERRRIELWDLDLGRLYATVPYRGLMRDGDYSFSIRLGRGGLIAFAANNADQTVAGALYGLDGGFRGMLAGGARKLDLNGAIETAGMVLILEELPDGKPHVVHTVDLATGAAPGRFSIPRVDDSAEKPELRRVAPGVVTATQWGKQLRLDVIDARRGTVRTLRAPTC
jgi:hypothetical protein